MRLDISCCVRMLSISQEEARSNIHLPLLSVEVCASVVYTELSVAKSGVRGDRSLGATQSRCAAVLWCYVWYGDLYANVQATTTVIASVCRLSKSS